MVNDITKRYNFLLDSMQHIYEIEIKGMSNLTNGLQKLTNVILIQFE